MCDVKVFSNSKIGRIRAVELDGELWLFLKDILGFIGGSTTTSARCIDEENRMHINALRNHYWVVNYKGITQLLERRNRKSFKNYSVFKEWVDGGTELGNESSEITIRKTSGDTYETALDEISKPEFWRRLFAEMDSLRRENKRLSEELEACRQKAALADTIVSSVTKCMRDYS